MSLLTNVRDSVFGLPQHVPDPSNPLPTPEQRLGLPGPAPAAAVSAGPAGAVVSTGAPAPGGQKPERRRVTKDLYFDESVKADFHEARDLLRLGQIAHVWCDAQLDYAKAIGELRQFNATGGLEGKALRTREQIAAWHVHELFDGKTVEQLSRSAICKLIPLIKRDTKTHAWAIRPGIESRAKELVVLALAEHWSVKATAEKVAALVRRKRPATKKADRVQKLQSQIKRLAPEQRLQLLHWLQADLNGKAVAA
jgi:hypothetical protein